VNDDELDQQVIQAMMGKVENMMVWRTGSKNPEKMQNRN